MNNEEESIELDEGKTSKKDASQSRNQRSKNLTFEQAREYIQKQQLPSVKAYYEWWDTNKPKMLPRGPERAYNSSWQGWNDFLGNENKWQANQQRNYRSYEEAVLFTHKLKLTSQNEWLEWCQENALPDDIPKRPDLYYDQWSGWGDWLGNNVVAKLKAHQQAETRIALFCIVRDADISIPMNVFTFVTEHEGISALREKWKAGTIQIFKTYWHDSSKMEEVQQIINALSSPWYGDNKQRVCGNIYDICWELDAVLEVARFN